MSDETRSPHRPGLPPPDPRGAPEGPALMDALRSAGALTSDPSHPVARALHMIMGCPAAPHATPSDHPARATGADAAKERTMSPNQNTRSETVVHAPLQLRGAGARPVSAELPRLPADPPYPPQDLSETFAEPDQQLATEMRRVGDLLARLVAAAERSPPANGTRRAGRPADA